MENQGQWRCNNCGNTEGVVSGICPDCGPTQTTPIDEVAKRLAGVGTSVPPVEPVAQPEDSVSPEDTSTPESE